MTSAHSTRSSRLPRRRLSEDERREQILQGTIRAVAHRGFEAATMSAIAEESGVSKGLISHYFATKTDLMKQAVASTVRGIRDELVADLDSSAPVPDLIAHLVRTIARTHRTRPDEFRAMDQITRRLQEPDGTPAFSSRDYEELYEGQETLFRKGQADGQFREFDTRVMAVTYQGAIDAMLSYLETHRDVDADAYAANLADVLLAAMRR